jgi:hypothetical protein
MPSSIEAISEEESNYEGEDNSKEETDLQESNSQEEVKEVKGDLLDNKYNRHKIKRLVRRMDHLAKRIKDNPNLSYDIAEHAALQWAIRVLNRVLILKYAKQSR